MQRALTLVVVFAFAAIPASAPLLDQVEGKQEPAATHQEKPQKTSLGQDLHPVVVGIE